MVFPGGSSGIDFTNEDAWPDVDFARAHFGGTDLSGVVLPSDANPYQLLPQVDRAVDYARKLYLALLLACGFCLLTVMSTTDADLIANSQTTALPVIGFKVGMADFFWAAPPVLFVCHLYFHVQLQRIWDRLATLPSIFPDGTPLDQKANPWLLLGMMRGHIPHLSTTTIPWFNLQFWGLAVLVYGAVPVTIIVMATEYLPSHAPRVTIAALVFVLVAFWFGVRFYQRGRDVLRGAHVTQVTLHRIQSRPWTASVYAAASLLLVLLLIFGIEPKTGMAWFPDPALTGADLSGADLRSDFNDGTLNRVDLSRTNLRNANLQGIHVDSVQLSDANLRGANLEACTLSYAHLDGADLRGANLQEAVVDSADLRRADLRGSNLAGARLKNDSLVSARLDNAQMNGTLVKQTDLSRASMQGVILKKATLLASSFLNTDLQGADFYGGNLALNRFEMANLREASFLTSFVDPHHYFLGANLAGADFRRLRTEPRPLPSGNLVQALEDSLQNLVISNRLVEFSEELESTLRQSRDSSESWNSEEWTGPTEVDFNFSIDSLSHAAEQLGQQLCQASTLQRVQLLDQNIPETPAPDVRLASPYTIDFRSANSTFSQSVRKQLYRNCEELLVRSAEGGGSSQERNAVPSSFGGG
jgi:uncharacterized protein YjbI with pentapeptide repeats